MLTSRFFGLLSIVLLVGVSAASAQTPAPTPGRTLLFQFNGATAEVRLFGKKVEVLDVLELIGAEAGYSPAAGTYGVVLGEHFIQFAAGRQYVLVDGTLQEARDKPVASPGGIAVSTDFLERSLLSPLGHHLEAVPGGYRIVPGARFADPVTVRPAAADFDSTTTLVLTLNRLTPARVESMSRVGAVVYFEDATPQIDATVALRSRRVKRLQVEGQRLLVQLARGEGLLTWHTLEDPPRVILEVGRVLPTPTPAPARVAPIVTEAPIVIDPGHGGDDLGATTPSGLEEKDLTLAIARHLERILRGRGHTVRLTRSNDENRALTDRTALANRLQAKVFISLHANASTYASVRGAETYYMSLDQSSTDAAAAATAEVENRPATGQGERSALDLILWDLAQSEVLNESARLAVATQTRLNSLLGLRDRGVKQAPFVVLTGATMPAALVEIGFLSNRAEAERLSDPGHQARLAEAIALGIEDFLGTQ